MEIDDIYIYFFFTLSKRRLYYMIELRALIVGVFKMLFYLVPRKLIEPFRRLSRSRVNRYYIRDIIDTLYKNDKRYGFFFCRALSFYYFRFVLFSFVHSPILYSNIKSHPMRNATISPMPT